MEGHESGAAVDGGSSDQCLDARKLNISAQMRKNPRRDADIFFIAEGVENLEAYPSTPSGYTTYFYAMLCDSTIHGYSIPFNSESSTCLDADSNTATIETSIVVSGVGALVEHLNGTHMTVSALIDPASGHASLILFAQTEEDDIELFRKGIEGRKWMMGLLSVNSEQKSHIGSCNVCDKSGMRKA
jgi:hypothetical protein